jgi:methylated-DNA-protein-cysteine methyltransferase-like protein
MASTRYQQIYETVSRIPPGKVATYGQIATLAGYPGCARQVGYALNALSDDSDVPWQRVINAQGKVSPRSDPECPTFQEDLLVEEGVVFGASGKVDLSRFGWDPEL